MATCAYRCTQRDDCCAFEFSRIKKMCQLQSKCFPNNPPFEDYRFCQKCKYNLSYCWFVLYTWSVATWRGSALPLLIILMVRVFYLKCLFMFLCCVFYLVMWETLNSPCVFKITRIKYLCEGNLITILTMPEDLYNDESIIN